MQECKQVRRKRTGKWIIKQKNEMETYVDQERDENTKEMKEEKYKAYAHMYIYMGRINKIYLS